tara:strand:+ start:244 stop:492 length:249 start_codon:yes stop_codon:yes gene_type:complete
MSNRTWFFSQRKDDWSTGIGMVPPPMSKDDPNCQADCECHDMPDVSESVELTPEAEKWFKEQGLRHPEEVRQIKLKNNENNG